VARGLLIINWASWPEQDFAGSRPTLVLYLTRKPGETIVINENVEITVVPAASTKMMSPRILMPLMTINEVMKM
jgi:hypothetical protein